LRVLASHYLEPLFFRLRKVLAQRMLFLVLGVAKSDGTVLRVIHIQSLVEKRDPIEVLLGELSLRSIFILYQSVISLFEENLDLLNIPIDSKQLEEVVWLGLVRHVGDKQHLGRACHLRLLFVFFLRLLGQIVHFGPLKDTSPKAFKT